MNQHSQDSSFVDVAFDGLLIDMDGTIIDSTKAVIKHWHNVGKEIGVDPDVILEISHGRRSLDVLQILAPAQANWEFVRKIEGAIPTNHGDLATLIPGAATLMDVLMGHSCKWAIVTSSSLPLVMGWFERLKLPLPPSYRLITAEMVYNGKPDPACYYLGRQCLDLTEDSRELLVIEDSPAGIKAGKDAGCKVIGLLTTHSYDEIAAFGPDWIIESLKSLQVLGKKGQKVHLKIQNLT